MSTFKMNKMNFIVIDDEHTSDEENDIYNNTDTNIGEVKEIKIKGGKMYYFKNFIDSSYYEFLKKEIDWSQEKCQIFGKTLNQPRLTSFMGIPTANYTYSGIKRMPKEMTPAVSHIMKKTQLVVSLIEKDQPLYTSVLANYYRDGNDNIGLHADDEKTLLKDSIIASVSMGSPRFFDLYSKEDKKKVMRLELEDGSLLLMGKGIQQLYKHSVPVQKKVKSGRINLTMRVIN
jgi:alkylated DNA repair dioxygenase AlkB